MQLHPLCELFPRMTGAEYESLKKDIAAGGMQTPIVLHEGKILDGGNRFRACSELGVEPRFVDFIGEDPVAFVLSINLHRRHLQPGQHAAIVSAAQDWGRAHGRGGDRKSDQSATLHRDSSADRAALSGASLRTQKMADKVAKADPKLARKVAHGEVSLPDALAKITGTKRKPPTQKKDWAAGRPDDAADVNPEDAHADVDPMKEWAAAEARCRALEERVEAFTATDQGKELDKQMRLREIAVRNAEGVQTTNRELQKQIARMERDLHQITGKTVHRRSPVAAQPDVGGARRLRRAARDHPRQPLALKRVTERIQVCSQQTLARRDWPEADLIIVDECHTVTETTKRRLGKRDTITIGLTATPFTKGLGLLYDAMVNVTTTDELIARGYLSPYRIFAASEPNMEGVKVVAGEWEEGETSKRAMEVVGDCVAEYIKHGDGRKFICSAVDTAHVDEIQRQFMAAGIQCAAYTYKVDDTEREQIVAEFRKPDSFIRGLITVTAASKGFDVPDIGVVIMARPLRKSLAEHIQFFGRGLRAHPGQDRVHRARPLRQLGAVLGRVDRVLRERRCRARRRQETREAGEARRRTRKTRCGSARSASTSTCRGRCARTAVTSTRRSSPSSTCLAR
jgi:hypothetical protein